MKLKNNIRLLITCDSGAGAGKTTVAKYISKKFKLNLLTSGLLYRYVAHRLIVLNKTTSDNSVLKRITKNINPKLLKNKKLYSIEVTKFTSKIAKVKRVRQLLKKYQKKFATKRLAILEGRDMGILFPNADIKFFFKCSLKIAAKRRFEEFKKNNPRITLKEVEKSIKLRNLTDTKRKNSPLRIPKGAVLVDTTKLTKKRMFKVISKIIEKKLLLKYGRSYKATKK
ncbi:MAG: cytidylate kinase [Pelagibacterales bacterium]|nr:cytidylate kinase [Pelagibacterales bacterium]